MLSFSSRSAASVANLSSESEVEIRRFSASSKLYPALYKKVEFSPTHILKFQDAVGNWFEIADYTILSPLHAGALGGTTNDTLPVQTVIDLAQAREGVVDLGQLTLLVDKISIGGSNQFFEIRGNAVLSGASLATQSCLLEITRGNFTVSGSITVFGQYKTNYLSGIWVHNDTQLQSADLSKLVLVGCMQGLRIGDVTHPRSVTSEITIQMPRTYGCPRALRVEGAQTYVTVVAPCPISADGFGGDAAWNAQIFRAVTNIGANLTINGGEVIQTSSGSPTDWLCEIQPCNEGPIISWGRTNLVSVAIETGGPLCLIHNPLQITGTTTPNDRPRFTVIDCFGYHPQDNEDFIKISADFPGDIVWNGNNVWYPGTRSKYNIRCLGTLSNVYVDDVGFGNGFLGPISGTIGGIVHFSKRSIYQAIGLPKSGGTPNALNAGLNTMKWQSFVPSDDNLRWQAQYSAASGEFTIPSGGLRNFRLRAQVYAVGVVGYLVVRDNGVEVARNAFADAAAIQWEAINISEFRKIKVDLFVVTGAGVKPSVSDFLNTFLIEAIN